MKMLIALAIMLVLGGCTNHQSTVVPNEQRSSGARIDQGQVADKMETGEESDLFVDVNKVRTGIFSIVSERYEIRGGVRVEGRTIKFSDDFEVSDGPDLFVHLGKDGQYARDARVARLESLSGAQEYRIPDEVDPAGFDEVWIWCRAFNVGFGMARVS